MSQSGRVSGNSVARRLRVGMAHSIVKGYQLVSDGDRFSIEHCVLSCMEFKLRLGRRF